MNHIELLPSSRRNFVVRQVFDTLDVSETTRREYAVRIRHFLRFTDTHGLNRNSYLEYKRYLQGCETFSVSTKNKYLISAKIFLDGLHRAQLIPQKITDGVKRYRKVAVVLFRTGANKNQPKTESDYRSLFVSGPPANRGRPVGCHGY